MYRIGYVFQAALADVLERNLDDLPDLIVDGLRDAYAPGLGELLETSGNVWIDWQKVVKGLVLIAAVFFDVYNKNKSS